MRTGKEKFVMAMALAVVGIGLSWMAQAAVPEDSAAKEAVGDPGYFLSWQQKVELIREGEITDAAGRTYEIWICPGYAPPLRYGGGQWEEAGEKWVDGLDYWEDAGRKWKDGANYWKEAGGKWVDAVDSWKDAGDKFAEYWQARKYHDLAKHSGDCFEFSYDKCLVEKLWRGVPGAWGEYFGLANERTRRRLFGWTFAYPVAFFQSFGDNTARVPVCLMGSIGGAAAGALAVPFYHALDSSVAGTALALGPGMGSPMATSSALAIGAGTLWPMAASTALAMGPGTLYPMATSSTLAFAPGMLVPLSGCVWNTLASPPLALAARKPAPERCDRFWCVIKKTPPPVLSEAEIKEFANAAATIMAPMNAIKAESQTRIATARDEWSKAEEANRQEFNRKNEEARRVQAQKEKAIRQDERNRLDAIAVPAECTAVLGRLRDGTVPAESLDAAKKAIVRQMKRDGLDGNADHAFDFLRQNANLTAKDFGEQADPGKFNKFEPVGEASRIYEKVSDDIGR